LPESRELDSEHMYIDSKKVLIDKIPDPPCLAQLKLAINTSKRSPIHAVYYYHLQEKESGTCACQPGQRKAKVVLTRYLMLLSLNVKKSTI
jgi:hypothetical protein